MSPISSTTSTSIMIGSLVALILVAQHCHCRTLVDVIRDGRLLNSGDVGDFLSRPDDDGDLQQKSARLHRTLFLLDTSDLLKKARLLGAKLVASSTAEAITSDNQSLNENDRSGRTLTTRTKNLFNRWKREAKPQPAETAKYINIIKVRKPFLTIDEEPHIMIDSHATRR